MKKISIVLSIFLNSFLTDLSAFANYDKCNELFFKVGIAANGNNLDFSSDERRLFYSRKQYNDMMDSFFESSILKAQFDGKYIGNEADLDINKIRTFELGKIKSLVNQIKRTNIRDLDPWVSYDRKFGSFFKVLDSVNENYKDYYLTWLSFRKEDIPWSQIYEIEKGMTLNEFLVLMKKLIDDDKLCEDGKLDETPYAIGLHIIEQFFNDKLLE